MTGMNYLFYVLNIILIIIASADRMQTFLEDAGQYTIYCQSSSLQVYVYLVRTNIESRIYTCTNISIPCKNGIGNGTAEFNSTGSYFPFYYKDIVFIRSIIGIKCFYPEINNNYTDHVLIVAKPQNLSCDVPALSTDNKSISITCRTAKVYPQANCTFDMQNLVTGTLTNNNVKYSEVVEYYNTTCTWTSPLSNFDVGQYQYNISFFPSKINNNMNYGASLTQSIQFTLPILHLSDECFNGTNIVNGYIKPGTTVNCMCYSTSMAFPPAFISWINSHGQNVGTFLNSTATSLTISEAMDNTTFNCLHSSYLKNGNVSHYYTAQYAKGPTTCNVEPKNTAQTIWIICNTEKIVNVSLICSVNKSDVKPGIKSIISINSTNSLVLVVLESEGNNMSNNMYITNYEAMLTQAGNYTIDCQVQNSLFNNLNTKCTYSKALQVYAPPELLPSLQITNKNKQNVEVIIQENEVYVVECSVLGGVPSVSNVTVSCGNITNSTQSGNNFTSLVTFARNMTGQNCTCTAQHITGCYTKNMVQQQLNILYVPTIIQFHPNSTTAVDNGTWTMFVCEADGNPLPQISIIKGNLTLYENFTQTAYLNKSMTCTDSGTYIYQAINSLKTSQTPNIQTVIIDVKCPFQLIDSENYKVIRNQLGQPFIHTFNILGYPEPSKFDMLNLNNISIVDFNINYTRIEPSINTIKISKLNLSQTDFSNFTLVIYQNGSFSFNYNFIIIKVDASQNTETEADKILPAAIGGGLGAGCLVIIVVIIFAYLFKQGQWKKLENFYENYSKKKIMLAEEDNKDVYFLKNSKKETAKTIKAAQPETYKNYTDIIPTITSATAFPKNMYKPPVKEKPKISNSQDYYNFVEPQSSAGPDTSDKNVLLDENVYANQSFKV